MLKGRRRNGSPEQIMNASAPFDDPGRKIEDYLVARTHDRYRLRRVDFYVDLRRLPDGSFFHNLYKDATPAENLKHNIPVAVIDEESGIMRKLLLFFYPSEMRQLHWDGVELSGMIELAQKYCLETGEFPKRLVQALGRPSRWCKPEDLYLVGVKYRMQELCTFAAKCSTNLDLYPRSIVPFPTSEVEALSLSPVLPQAIIAWGKFQEAARKSVSMLVNAIQKESRWIACKGLPFDITFESREDFELSGHSDACIRTFEGSQGSSIWTLAGELDPENPSEDDLYAKKITAPRWFRQLLDEIALKYSAYPHREAFADHPIISNAVARVGKCPMCGEDPALLALEIRDWCTKFADDVDNFMEFILSDSYSYSYTWNNCDASLRRWKEEFSLVSQLQFH